MKKVIDFIKKHNYLMILLIFIGFSISLSLTYSNFIVTSNDHKAAEMYIGELKYSIEIDGSSTNTLTVPTGETIIDVKVNNLNPVDTYYKLLYLKNSNLIVEYFSSAYDLDDSNNVTKSYDKPNDSVTLSNSKTIKLQITNSSTSSQTLGLSVKGGYITNTLSDIAIPSNYSEIASINTKANTYFCKTAATLKQGLEYVNGQYTYRYKQDGELSSSGLAWSNISTDGWGVQLTDKTSTDTVTSKACTYINNKPIASMLNMFSNSQSTSIDLSDFNTSKVTNMSGMFYNSKATTINLSNFDTSNVTDMNSMFGESQAVTLDLSNFDTSNVTNMLYMFSSSKVTTLDLSNFDTSKVTNMASMFRASQATTLNISNFDTSNVTDMSYMFLGSQATTLNISNFDTSKVTRMSYMFANSRSLKTIYVSNKFNTDAVTDSTRMFRYCNSLVGGSGTVYDSTKVDKTYARIDGGTSNPGYFTDIADINIPAPNSFATDSWKTIIKAVRNNNISKYNVGDTRSIDLGDYGTHTLRLSNTSTPSECSNTGFSQTACGFVIEFADIITTHNMNSTNTNVGGWPASSLYTFVNVDLYNSLSSDLKSGIIDTTVVSGKDNTASNNYVTSDKLYLLATAEISQDAHNYDVSKDVTRQLDYYKSIGITKSNYSGAIKKNGSSANEWWLRSAINYITIGFITVDTTGIWGASTGEKVLGVSPAFRIG